MVDLHVCGDFAQPRSTGGEEPAEQAAGFESFEPGLPGFRGGAQPIKDSCELGGYGGLSLAEKPAGKIDQEQVASESMIENPPTATAKISASSSSRFSIHSLRSNGVSLSRKARRTQRVTQP